MAGCLYHCKGEIYWKAAVQMDSRDGLVAKWQEITFKILIPLAKKLYLEATE